MTNSILVTKLFIPPSSPKLVTRPLLIEQLDHGLHRKLSLISAPAGFGKTTLVVEWIAACERREPPLRAAWLSLDESDSDPVRFLTYLIAAIQKIRPNIGEGALAALRSAPQAQAEAILTVLVNEIAAYQDKFILCLDDYHVIDSHTVDNALTFLLKHLPPNLHLVITTREDPQLPLARLRARGQLTELRIADLRFTTSEAAEFLNQAMGLDLSAEDIEALETRTEGWIAGLQMAALSMKGQPDSSKFIQSFTGSHHFVLDYLLEEVLNQQPKSVQTFLLLTSILDRLCGPLCDVVVHNPAVPGQEKVSVQETLEYLAQANLFIIPLDNVRRWYRYHHLFADLLRKRLTQHIASFAGGEGMDVAGLHIRASQWYEDQGLEIEAFQHAAAANDFERSARLVEGGGMPLHFRGAMALVLNWLESLPSAMLDARPSLWVTYVSALTMIGRPINLLEEKLQAAESAVKNAAPGAGTQDLLGQIASIRAMLAIPKDDIEAVIAQSRRALKHLDPENLPVRTTASWTLGYAYQQQGDRAAASRMYLEAISNSQRSGNTMMLIAAKTSLGQVQESQNQLHQAAEAYQSVLQIAGEPPLPMACEAHLGLARVSYQWNELEIARSHGHKSLKLALQIENVDTPAVSRVLLGRLKLAQGDPTDAALLFSEAEQFLRQHHSMHRMPEVAAAQVLTLIQQGDLDAAMSLAKKHNLPLSQARVHLASGDSASALALLEPLRREAENKDWQDERLEVTVLQAIAYNIQNEKAWSRQILAEALALAEPGGFIRIFVDEGSLMAALLQDIAKDGAGTDYGGKLLQAFGKGEVKPAVSAVSQDLIEPLSERELEVLRLLGTYLTGPEIARELLVSLNTLRTHTKNIYKKLGVNNRQAAVRRAEEIDLL